MKVTLHCFPNREKLPSLNEDIVIAFERGSVPLTGDVLDVVSLMELTMNTHNSGSESVAQQCRVIWGWAQFWRVDLRRPSLTGEMMLLLSPCDWDGCPCPRPVTVHV